MCAVMNVVYIYSVISIYSSVVSYLFAVYFCVSSSAIEERNTYYLYLK